MQIKSCKGCTQKYEGCHDRCSRYLSEWLAETDWKKEVRQERDKRLRTDNYKFDVISHNRKKR